MAEYWPSSFFACLWTRVKVHKLTKKEQVQYPTILTKQTWAIKDFLYGFREKFFAWDTVDSPERALGRTILLFIFLKK